MSRPRIILAVVGVLIALAGLGFAAVGIGTLVARQADLGPDGFYETPVSRVATPAHALAGGEVDLGTTPSTAVPLLPSIGAVVLGIHARRRIDASDAPIAGRGVATVGMALGWAGVVLCPALIALLVLVLGPGGEAARRGSPPIAHPTALRPALRCRA